MSDRDLIVVTGASGRVGHQVARLLLSEGRNVRVVARTAENLKSPASLGADVRTGAIDDRVFLTTAFRGASVVFLLTPVDTKAQNVNTEQRNNVAGLAGAIRDSGVKNVVALSSWGAELSERVGGIIGCHWLEQALNEISDLNSVCLRPVWFMENFIWNIGLIKMANINGLALRPDFAFPMIATKDIAPVAAKYLAKLDFTGRHIHYLNGPKDYALTEVTQVLGNSIGKPNLKYIEFPNGIFRKGLIDNGGLSPNAADMAIEINRGIESGQVHAEPRTKSNTTPTTLEEFARTTFAPAFNAAPNVSFTGKMAGAFLRSFLFFVSPRVQRPLVHKDERVVG